MNRARGELETLVMEKRFEAQVARLGSLVVTAGRHWEMTLLMRRARPMRKYLERGSSMTTFAGAILLVSKRKGAKEKGEQGKKKRKARREETHPVLGS